jgi:hypothetical protein
MMGMSNAIVEHVILSPVPTPEEMAARLGISEERVAALRRIMRARGATVRGAVAVNRQGFRRAEPSKTTRAQTKPSTKGLHGKAASR